MAQDAVGFLDEYRVEQISRQVFQKLEDYAVKRHSNVVSVFRDFDKDQSGAMDSHELQYALRALLPGLKARLVRT